MKIALDVFGGDNAPDEILQGAVMALNCDKEIGLVLCGDSGVIEERLKTLGADKSRVEIVHAPQVITNDDVPTSAIRTKKDSSLVAALQAAKRDDVVGMVSAGSTGAVLAGSIFIVGRIKGITRPALAPLLPTITGGQVLLIDCGANVDCKPQHLVDFAKMGSAYMAAAGGIKSPKVALLSNGVEEQKGNELNKEAHVLLKETSGINFVGNMEAREILSGDFDVVVTDGFAGNIALKSLEGTASAIFKLLKAEIHKSFKSKVGALMLKGAFKGLKSKLDHNDSGGAQFLGVNKIVIKSHGSSGAKSICASILQVKNLSGAHLIESIRAAVGEE